MMQLNDPLAGLAMEDVDDVQGQGYQEEVLVYSGVRRSVVDSTPGRKSKKRARPTEALIPLSDRLDILLDDQEQKEVRSKRAAAMPADAHNKKVESLGKEIDNLNSEVRKSLSGFIEDEESNTRLGLKDYKIEYLKEAVTRSEQIGERIVANRKHNPEQCEALHAMLVDQELQLAELLRIEERHQKALAEMDRIGKRTPSWETIAELQVLEAGFIARKCPNRVPCQGRMHPGYCSPDIEHYRSHSLTVLTKRAGDLKGKIETGITEHIVREKELAKKLAQEQADRKAKEQAQIHDARPSKWVIFGAIVGTGVAIALIVKSYFWLRK